MEHFSTVLTLSEYFIYIIQIAFALLIGLSSLLFLLSLVSHHSFSYHRKHVLITGGSSGIGIFSLLLLLLIFFTSVLSFFFFFFRLLLPLLIFSYCVVLVLQIPLLITKDHRTVLLYLRSGARQSLFKGGSECYHCRSKSIEATESRSRSFSFQNRGTDSQHRLRRCEQLGGRGRHSLRLSLQPHWRCRRARQLRRVTSSSSFSSFSSSSSSLSVSLL